MPLKMVSRATWGAKPPSKPGLLLHVPARRVIITHTLGKTCWGKRTCTKLLQQLQKKQMKKHLDIVYNFLVGGDKRIYEGTGYFTNNFFPAPADTPEEVTKGGVPRGARDLLRQASKKTVATGKPHRWNKNDPRFNGETISIAFIGDHSDIFKELQTPRQQEGYYDLSQPILANPNSDLMKVVKPQELELAATEVIAWGVDHRYIDINSKVQWCDRLQWRKYLADALTWQPKLKKIRKQKCTTM